MPLATHGLAVRYPHAAADALAPADLRVESAHTLAIVGPSGAGKTTLLRAIAGLVRAQGVVKLDERVFRGGDPPRERRIAMVFQHDPLVATMTVRENLRFAARDGASVDDIARRFGIAEHLSRRPHDISGGERSRAAFARAVLSGARALLLDEPFAHLDPPLRADMLRWMRALRDTFRGPILYVTHDHRDALAAGDRVAVLIGGRIVDVGEPARVYHRPASLAAAQFFGERPMNVLDGRAFDRPGLRAAFRAEAVRIAADGWRARVLERTYTGSDAYLLVGTDHGEIVMRVPASFSVENELRIAVAADSLAFYDASGGIV